MAAAVALAMASGVGARFVCPGGYTQKAEATECQIGGYCTESECCTAETTAAYPTPPPTAPTAAPAPTVPPTEFPTIACTPFPTSAPTAATPYPSMAPTAVVPTSPPTPWPTAAPITCGAYTPAPAPVSCISATEMTLLMSSPTCTKDCGCTPHTCDDMNSLAAGCAADCDAAYLTVLGKYFGGCSCSTTVEDGISSGAHRSNGSTTVFQALFWLGLVLALASAANASVNLVIVH